METHLKEARDCGRDMFKDGLPITLNPYVMPYQKEERDAWIEGYRIAANPELEN